MARATNRSTRLVLLGVAPLLGLAVSCGEADTPVGGELIVAPIAPDPVVIMQLVPPEVEPGSRIADRAGLVLGLLELGLTDLDGVSPQIGDTPVSPGLQSAIATGAQLWVGSVDVPSWSPLKLSLSLCDPKDVCVTTEVEDGTAEDPSPAVGALLRAVAARLLLPVPPDNAWTDPGSEDLYAVLLAGRAASALYGLRDPVPAELVHDKRRDPIERAVYVDPGMPLAGWVAGRRAALLGEHATARSWFARAGMSRPSSLVLLADEAAEMVAEGKPKLAWTLWQSVERRSPHDLRYALGVAGGALAAGRADDASTRLAALPARLTLDPHIAELRVEVAEARGTDEGYDALLATWELADAADPEPTRRRIRLRVRDGRYTDALTLVEALRARGAGAEADAVALSLEASLGRWDDAAARADAIGDPGTASRLRARAALHDDDGADVTALAADPSLPARLALARAALRDGRGADAAKIAREILVSRPADRGALAVLADALDATGAVAEATKTRARLAKLEPAEPPLVGAVSSKILGEPPA